MTTYKITSNKGHHKVVNTKKALVRETARIMYEWRPSPGGHRNPKIKPLEVYVYENGKLVKPEFWNQFDYDEDGNIIIDGEVFHSG